MQATGSSNNNLSSGISERSVTTSSDEGDTGSKAGPSANPGQPPENDAARAAAHALDQYRLDALRSIDEAGFSCVVKLSPYPRLLTALYSGFHIKVILVVGIGFFTDA
jgi:hypothetical protein